MLLYHRHFFFCVKLRLTALLRGPEGTLLFRPVRVQEDLEVCVLLCQLVEQAHVVVQAHQHRVQAGRPFVWVRSFQPLTALKPAPQLLQPICTQLGHPALIHLEHQIHRTAVHHIWELRVRCVGCVLLRLGAKDVPETLQPLLIDGDAGDGALLIVGVRVQPLLERPVGVGVDPVVFHLFQGGSGFDLFFQGQELMIARFQC